MNRERIDWNKLSEFERARAEDICRHFFPRGKKTIDEWKIADVSGAPGESLGIQLTGERASLWRDRATNEGGRLRKLIAQSRNISDEAAVDEIEHTFGISFRKNGDAPRVDKAANGFSWARFVNAVTDQHLDELDEWRGYSLEYCRSLKNRGLIGRHKEFWAFPVWYDGQIVAGHVRIDKHKWFFEPELKVLGIKNQPLIIGDLTGATQIFISESQWDLFAWDSITRAYEMDGVCLISARGAGNAGLLPIIPPNAQVFVLVQRNKAGEKFLSDVSRKLKRSLRAIRPPEGFEDINDWVKGQATAAQMVEAMKTAVLVELELDPLDEPTGKADEEESFEWLKPKFVSQLTTIQPEQVLRGILYQRCKMVLMGGSKSFKTWTLMDIAYCVANGLLWWGIHTKQCPVIYLDFELLDYDFRWRMEQIALAHSQGNIDAVKRIGMRGKTLGNKHWSQIHKNVLAEGAGLAVADPTYKLLGPNRDENSAGDIAQVTALFDHITEETGAAAIYAQHFSKGNQAGKESIDRGAGSGVWARDADAIVTMTKHEQEECLTVEHTLRSFPRIDPFVVRWNCPLFERAPDLDPADLKQASGGRQPTYSMNDILDCLNGQDLTTAEFQRLVENETGAKAATFYRLLKEATKQGLVHKSRIDQKWERVSKP